MTGDSSGAALPSPNIWRTPEVYELENLASDPDGLIDARLEALHPLRGAVLLDLGCGNGFHLPRFAQAGARVIGVEPHLPLVVAAHARGCRPLTTAPGSPWAPVTPAPAFGLVAGAAQHLPLADHSVDIVHSRWAYFFGAGCEPGLAEVQRVLRPGGIHVVVDNDATHSTFGAWFRRAYPAYDPDGVRRFWARRGYTEEPLTIRWVFARREDLAAVLAIEFPPAAAATFLAEHRGLTVDYAVALRWWRAP